MAYDFIGLVNDVNNRLNEVELDSSNFTTATGYFSYAKDSVNAAIRHIQQEEYEWPWNNLEQTDTLTPGIVRYSYPNDAKTINFNTFRIKRSSTLNIGTRKLKVLSYEEYLEKYADNEYNTDAQGMPTHVVRTPAREVIYYPAADEAYDVVYEYYRIGYDLIGATDVPPLPEQYRFAIVNGAMFYVYQFRGDQQNATIAKSQFDNDLKYLRSLNINRMDYVRDTRVHY